MEEQIQHYCSNLIKKLSLTITIFIIFYLFYFIYIQKFYLENKKINITKGSNLKQISSLFFEEYSLINKKLFYYYFYIWDNYIDEIHYGEFQFSNNLNLYEITRIISQPSNVYYQFTVVDGWQQYQLDNNLIKLFNKKHELKYEDILADTYKYQSTDSLDTLINLMKNNKKNFFIKNINNELLLNYSEKEIMIIASLVEKEGLDDLDKKLISSVIFNRLKQNIKLQIDASTIFSITKGKYKFQRKLTFKDLNIEDKYNTYHINGLPPSPICFVSSKTIELVLENYKSDYLFYFYNENLKKHVFTKSFKEHKSKLLKYRMNNEQ